MSIKVVTDANETSKIVCLKVDSTVHIVAIVVVYVGKTMAASSNIGTILGSMFAYLVNYQAINNVDIIEFWSDFGLTIGDWTIAHYAVVGRITIIGGQ